MQALSRQPVRFAEDIVADNVIMGLVTMQSSDAVENAALVIHNMILEVDAASYLVCGFRLWYALETCFLEMAC